MTTTTGSIESVSYKDEECCSICLESIRQQQEIPDKSPLLKLAHTTPSMVCLTPACHHIFHSFCLLRFLSSNITSNLCPNCRAPIRKDLNVFKLIYLPDSIFSVIKPTDIQPTTIQIQPAAPETTRLIRDLEARAVQIRDLELQLLQNANGADSDTDSDDANDAEFDNLNTLVQQQQEQISNLLCQVSKLEHDNSLLKKKKLDQTNECTELIKKNTALHQKQLEYKRTTELLQNKLKETSHANDLLEKRLKAYKVIESISNYSVKTAHDWQSKLIELENSSQTRDEMLGFLRSIFKALEEATDQFHIFRDRAFKLKEEKQKLKIQLNDKDEELQKAISESKLALYSVNHSMEKENFKINIPPPVNRSVCVPGSMMRSRAGHSSMSTLHTSIPYSSDGMGGRAKMFPSTFQGVRKKTEQIKPTITNRNASKGTSSTSSSSSKNPIAGRQNAISQYFKSK